MTNKGVFSNFRRKKEVSGARMQLVVGGWPLLAERHKREWATGNRLGLKDHKKERILLQNPAAGEQLPVS